MSEPKRCTTCYSPLTDGRCTTCTRATLFQAGHSIGDALGFKPIGKALCGMVAASLPEIFDAFKKANQRPTLPTQTDLDEQIKKLAATVPTAKA